MQWTEDGRIQITRKFALGAAAAIAGLALATMFLIGIVIGGDREGDSGNAILPTPTVLADEQPQATQEPRQNPDSTRRPTSTTPAAAPTTPGATPTTRATGTKTEYSTCLVRTQKILILDAGDARFTPWSGHGDKSVWEVIRYRHTDYISDYCQDQAPAPPSTYSGTCIPKELQSFYRRHIPEGADNERVQAIAAQYALTVCQPSAER